MIKIVEITENKEEYNKLATHPLQSWEWGEFRKAQGYKVVRLGTVDNDRLKNVFELTLHKIPHTSLTVGYLPKSSLPTKEIIDKLKEIGRKEKTIFIKLEPNVESREADKQTITKLGLVPGKSLFTKYTSVINLAKNEDELLKTFKTKTRYNIHLAEKHGVVVKEDNSPEAFEKYLDLIFETTTRQGFYAHNKKFHRQQWQIMQPAGISHLLTASWHGQILAAFLLFVFNNVLYYPYGASTREHKELMAPSLLLWEAIKFGKKTGCKSFDLWGDIEPNPPANHPYFGFHRFKEGFSPKLVEFVGTYDLIINLALYYFYQIADKLRWKILRLKSKI